MLMHQREPVCLRFGPLLSSLLVVAGFSAVLDFWQKLADTIDILIRPKVNGHAPAGNGFWSGNFLG